MGKGSAKQEVSQFYMSIHLGLCHGPLDAITGLFVGEKEAWTGEITDSANVAVNAPNLFGGPKSNGGVGGVMVYLKGGRDQVMPDELAQRYGLSSNTSPGYRGVASVFFIGSDGVPAGAVDTGGSGGFIGGGGAGTSSGAATSDPYGGGGPGPEPDPRTNIP